MGLTGHANLKMEFNDPVNPNKTLIPVRNGRDRSLSNNCAYRWLQSLALFWKKIKLNLTIILN